MMKDFNPLSPCGERPDYIVQLEDRIQISIHSPHAGRDSVKGIQYVNAYQFQSTLPMRGETLYAAIWEKAVEISIHSPHAGRDPAQGSLIHAGDISIHSPHAGRD